jgi:hypothetical protein
MRFVFYFALCLMLSSCAGCECCYSPDYECIETQDAVVIRYETKTLAYDSLVIKKDNKTTIGSCIGSKTHNAEFPIHANAQLFLHGTLFQSYDLDIPANSILTFYDGNDCEMADSTKLRFHLDVQQAIDNGVFIDSSSSGITCWTMKQMPEEYLSRCFRVEDEGGVKSKATYCR